MLNWMDVNRTFNELELFRREMDRLFSDAVQGELRGSLSQASGRVGADLRTTEEAFVLSVDVPGIDPGDIDLQITRDGVTLRAERRLEAPEGYATHRQERSSWRLSRSWNLPMPINPDAAEAVVKNGVLVITMPKADEVQPRRIAVKA